MVVVDLDKVERALDLLESEDVPQEQRYNADNYAKNNLDYILSNANEEERELTEEEIAIIKRGEEYYNVQVLDDGRVIQKEADIEILAEEERPKETKKNKKKKELKKNKDEKKEASNKYQKTSKKIKKHTKNLTPEDIIEQVSNAPIGTPEYKAVKEAVNKLKEINSTDRVNIKLRNLGIFGGIGIALSLVVGLMGFSFDIEYHFPFLHETIGNFFFWLFVAFGTMLIMSLIHIPMDGLVNKKWKTVSRNYLMILLVIGIPLKIYIDYKAIVNYSNIVAEKQRQKSLQDKTKVIGNSYSNIQKVSESQSKDLERVNKQLDMYNSQLAPILPKITKVQNSISHFKSLKRTRWRVKHIKELNAQLDSLTREKFSVENHIKEYEKRRDSLMGVIAKNSDKLNGLLSQSQAKADAEATARFWMMSAMLFLIELSSMLKVYSEFLQNKNQDIDMDMLHQLETAINSGEISNALGMRLIATVNASNHARNNQIIDMTEAQVYQSLAGSQNIVRGTQQIMNISEKSTKQALEIVEDLVEGANAKIELERYKRRIQLLEQRSE